MPDNNKNTGSTTTTNTPVPGMTQLISGAKGVFDSGNAWQPNTTSMVTPWSRQTTDAMKGMTDTAHTGQNYANENYFRVANQLRDGGLNNLQDQQVARLQGVAGGNGLNAEQRRSYNLLNPMASGNGLNSIQQQNVTRLNPMADGNGFNNTQQKAANYLDPIASGAARKNNPYLEDLIARGSQDIGNSANLMASAAGRYGSDSHAGSLGKQIADFSGNTRFADYNNQQQRQDSAIQNLFGMGTTGAGQKMNAINSQFGMGTAGAGQKMNAINSQFGMGTTGYGQKADAIGSLFNAGTQQRQNIINGTGQLSDAYNAKLQPYNTLSQVGAKNEDLYSRTLADKARIFSEKQNAQTAPINWLANLLGAAGGGQTVTNTSQPSGGIKGGLGGALAGFDTFGGPLGALFGGGLGALM